MESLNAEIEHSINKFISRFNIHISPKELDIFLNNGKESRSIFTMNDDTFSIIVQYLTFSEELLLTRTCTYYYKRIDELRRTIIDCYFPDNILVGVRNIWSNACLEWYYRNTENMNDHKEIIVKIKSVERSIKYCNSELERYQMVRNPTPNIKLGVKTYNDQLIYEKKQLEELIVSLPTEGALMITQLMWTSPSGYIVDIPTVDRRLYGCSDEDE